jgi:hypothetical protein
MMKMKYVQNHTNMDYALLAVGISVVNIRTIGIVHHIYPYKYLYESHPDDCVAKTANLQLWKVKIKPRPQKCNF